MGIHTFFEGGGSYATDCTPAERDLFGEIRLERLDYDNGWTGSGR
jgi:hypothetical protein